MKSIWLLFFPSFTYGQTVYKGNIVDKSSKTGISYATIGFIKNNSGTFSDSTGTFKLKSSNFSDDTLLITSAGYRSIKIAIGNFPATGMFEMQKNEISLSAIIMKSKYEATQILNDCSHCGNNAVISTTSTTQMAQCFQLKEPNALLKTIEVCTWGDNCKFRIRIYDYDSISGRPTIDLVDTILEIQTSRKHVQIDVQKYNIIIPNKFFFIAVEWLHIPLNESHYTTKLNDKKMVVFQYFPNISTKSGRKSTYLNTNNWQLNYDGKWEPFSMKQTNLMISATIKY